MHQEPLFLEDVNEAIKALVQALGGPKKVGLMLRPELTLDGASTWLRDCMNPDRRERLTPEQLILLMKYGRQANCNVLAAYLMGEVGYKAPEPLEPVDEFAELQRAYIQSIEFQKTLAARMERAAEAVRTVVRVPPVN